MVLWVKHMANYHQDPSLDLQHPCRARHGNICSLCSYNTMKTETGEFPRSSWARKPVILSSKWFKRWWKARAHTWSCPVTSTCIHVHTFRKIKKQRQETGEAAQQLSSRGSRPSSVIDIYIWWLTNSENINTRESDTCLSSSGTHTQAEYTHTSTHT